jgi:hypothetical protein
MERYLLGKEKSQAGREKKEKRKKQSARKGL